MDRPLKSDMSKLRLLASCLALTIVGTAVIAACSPEAPATGASTATVPTTTTVHVSAAAGGTVRDPAGKTTLTIPPGALEKDTDITLSIEGASAGAATDVSQFSPDGLVFVKPATLAISADASLAPAGASLSIATLEGDAFKAAPGSTYANGAAAAPIMHFSKWSVIVVAGRTVVAAPPASCAAAEAAFAPCGGDPKGTWRFAEFCAPPSGEAGKVDGCPELTATVDYEIGRDIVIDATTVTVAPGTYKATITINYPLVCFTRAGDGGTYDSGATDCAFVQNELYTKKGNAGTCVANAGGCSCTSVVEQPAPDTDTSTYTAVGSTMTSTDKNGVVSTSQYCVDGDILTIKEAGVDGGTGQVNVLARKK